MTHRLARAQVASLVLMYVVYIFVCVIAKVIHGMSHSLLRNVGCVRWCECLWRYLRNNVLVRSQTRVEERQGIKSGQKVSNTRVMAVWLFNTLILHIMYMVIEPVVRN